MLQQQRAYCTVGGRARDCRTASWRRAVSGWGYVEVASGRGLARPATRKTITCGTTERHGARPVGRDHTSADARSVCCAGGIPLPHPPGGPVCRLTAIQGPRAPFKGGGGGVLGEGGGSSPQRNSGLLHVCTGGGQHKSAERKWARQWPTRPEVPLGHREGDTKMPVGRPPTIAKRWMGSGTPKAVAEL